LLCFNGNKKYKNKRSRDYKHSIHLTHNYISAKRLILFVPHSFAPNPLKGAFLTYSITPL
jgi:hypothetical protein